MVFTIDSWLWKIALVLAIVGVREFVRQMNGNPRQNALNEAARQPGGVHSVRADKIEAGGEGENAQWIIETLDSMAIAIGLVLFVVQPFLLQAFWIPSGSMEDTLQYRPVGDRLLVSKFVYRVRAPRAGDVVVFQPPPQADAAPGDDFIKRCIGAPGDVIEFKNNRQLWRNGQRVNEPYTKWHELGWFSRPGPDGALESYQVTLEKYDLKIVGGKVYSREYKSNESESAWQQEHHSQTESGYVPPERQQFITDAPAEPVPPDKFLVLGDHRNNSNDGHVWGLVPRENIVGKAFCVFWPLSRAGLLDRMSQFPRPPVIESPATQLSPVAQ